MIKGAVQRRVVETIITIGEYLSWKQPNVFRQLFAIKSVPSIIIVADDYLSYKKWKRLMEEPPKPGRAGGE